MSYSKSLTNAQLAEARARILAKLEVDEMVGKEKKTPFGQKAKLVNDIIRDLSQEDTETFKKNASQSQKSSVVQNIIDQLRAERDDEAVDKAKKQVDREAEKLRDAPPVVRPDLSYAQKSAEVSNIQKFYARQVKQDAKDKQDIVRKESNKKDVFNFIKQAKPADDVFSYRRTLNKYSGINATRGYVENPQRIQYDDAVPGSYFSFRYFAKWYQELPKFDQSPLVYVLSNDGDRFTCINFHWCYSSSEAFDYIEQIESGNTNINFRDEMYHTYLKDSQYLMSPLYHIDRDEIRTAVLLPLVSWYVR